jgi:hypothetical protein
MSTILNKDVKEIVACRLCRGEFSTQILNLGSSSLANELYDDYESALNADRFPLIVVMCDKCKHIQLKHIVSPERLFSNYVYQSGFSSSFQDHFKGLAEYLGSMVSGEDYVLEIGSNDGLLLGKLNQIGVKSVGVEPSAQLVMQSKKIGLEVLHGFWSPELKNEIIKTYGRPKVITANNVFAHIEDMRAATSLIADALDLNGFFVFEVSYFLDVFRKNLFDTIYHEHMSYHTVIPLISFFNEFGLTVIEVSEIEIHGGSIRVTVARNELTKISDSIFKAIEIEKSLLLDQSVILKELEMKINLKREEVKSMVLSIKEGNFVFGFAAPAKLVTFLSVMHLERMKLEGIIDDNPLKQGKYLPSSGNKIVSLDDLKAKLKLSSCVNISCVVFAWNIGAELIKKLRSNFPTNGQVIQFMPDTTSVEL